MGTVEGLPVIEIQNQGVPMGTIVEITDADHKLDLANAEIMVMRGEIAEIEGERAEERDENMRLRRKCVKAAEEMDLLRSRLAVIGVQFPDFRDLIDDLKAEGV